MTVPVTIVHPADLASPRPSGIASFIRSFVKFAPPDFEIRLVGATRDPAVPLHAWSRVELAGREIEVLPLVRVDDSVARARVPISLRFTLALWRTRATLRLDGSVLQFHRPATALPLLRAGAGRIQVLHLTSADLLAPHSESRWRRVAGALHVSESATLPSMDRVIVVNEAGADAYRRRYPRLAPRIEFLGNWYDDAVFHVLAPSGREAARQEMAELLGAAPGDRLLLFAGRLDRQKRPDLLLDAFARLGRRDVRLAIVGDGQLRDRIAARLRDEPLGAMVRLFGYREPGALARLMNGSDALVISSGHETGPTVALEALACGLPVVSTRVGRLPTLLADGRAGLLADGPGADALARALAAFLEQPRDAMNEAAASAAQPHAASRALVPFYALHRRLVARR
jgi:glycosyltransferase involved in cell wall biosynthesis